MNHWYTVVPGIVKLLCCQVYVVWTELIRDSNRINEINFIPLKILACATVLKGNPLISLCHLWSLSHPVTVSSCLSRSTLALCRLLPPLVSLHVGVGVFLAPVSWNRCRNKPSGIRLWGTSGTVFDHEREHMSPVCTHMADQERCPQAPADTPPFFPSVHCPANAAWSLICWTRGSQSVPMQFFFVHFTPSPTLSYVGFLGGIWQEDGLL